MSAAGFVGVSDGREAAFAFLRDLGRVFSQVVIELVEPDHVVFAVPSQSSLFELLGAINILKRIAMEDAAAVEDRGEDEARRLRRLLEEMDGDGGE